jgi:hypothetical protein
MRLLISVGIVSILCSCSKKLSDVVLVEQAPVVTKEKELIHRLDSLANVVVKTFYSKLNVDYADSSQEFSFKTSLKIIGDSAINTIISYLNIPIVIAQINNDSVAVVNKRERCYTVKTLDYFKELIGIDLELRNLEELFMGRPIYFDTIRPAFLSSEKPVNIITSKISREQKEDAIQINYIFNSASNNLSGTEILSPADGTSVTINYLSRQYVNGINVPFETEILIITKQNRLFIRMRYDKVEINEPLELIFIIPEQYETCN